MVGTQSLDPPHLQRPRSPGRQSWCRRTRTSRRWRRPGRGWRRGWGSGRTGSRSRTAGRASRLGGRPPVWCRDICERKQSFIITLFVLILCYSLTSFHFSIFHSDIAMGGPTLVVLVKFPLEIALLQSPLLKILFWRKMIPVHSTTGESWRRKSYSEIWELGLTLSRLILSSLVWTDKLTEFLAMKILWTMSLIMTCWSDPAESGTNRQD